jgi:hypothetical protein
VLVLPDPPLRPFARLAIFVSVKSRAVIGTGSG